MIWIKTEFKKGDIEAKAAIKGELKVMLDEGEILQIAQTKGIVEANKAIDRWVGKFTTQFKSKLSQAING